MYSVQTQSFSTQYFHPMVACIRGCGISDAHWGPAAFYLLLDAVAFKMCLHHNNVFSVRRVTCFFITGNTKHMLSNKDVKIIPSAWKETFFFKQVSRIVHHRVSIISALQLPPPPVLFLVSGRVTEACQTTEASWFPCRVHAWQYSHLPPCSVIKPGIIQRFPGYQLSCQGFDLLLFLCCIAGSGDHRWSWAATLGSCACWARATSSAPNCVLITSGQALRVSFLKNE